MKLSESKQQVEEGIGPGNIGGMGPIQLPTDTEPGSGDVPAGRKSKEDEDDEKEKVKEVKDFIPTFEAFISEARDLNDPIAMRLRAAKAKANKKQEEPAKKEMSPAKAKKLAKLQDQRAEIMRDMEQEAEMEGGDTADKYGDMLNKIDKQIAKLQESVEAINEWGGSDQHAMNQSIHRELRKPKTMPSPFDKKLRSAAESAVDFYWDEWPEYNSDYEGLVDNAVRNYLRNMFRDDFNTMVRMFEPVDESLVLEMDSEGVQSLADELNAEVYTARLKNGAKSANITATTTTKTWDDGAPVLKYLARGKAKSMPFTLYQRPFKVLHDVANGWFYFTDGRKWYGLHGDEGYFEPEDLPFDMEISEDVVTEGYGEFIKAKSLTDIVNLSKENKRAVFYVTDDNNSRIGAFYLKNGKFAKATTANPSYDLQNNKTTLRDRSDVIYKYKVDESLVTEDADIIRQKPSKDAEKLKKAVGNSRWRIDYDTTDSGEYIIRYEMYKDNDAPYGLMVLYYPPMNNKPYPSSKNGLFAVERWSDGTELYYGEDYKKALDAINKHKESSNESLVTEARSIAKIQKEWSNVTAMMKDAVADWKKAEGQEKEDLLTQLKTLTTSKKKLEAELDAAVGLKDIDADLE